MSQMKIVLVTFILLLLAVNVSATDYTIKIGTELKSNIGWSAQRIDFLNASETISIPGGLSVSLSSDYYNTGTQQVWLKVSPLQSNSPDILLKENDKTCLRGNSGDNTDKCLTDPTNATEGTIRLTLMDITEQTTGTSSTSGYSNDSSEILDVYVITPTGEHLNIKKGDTPTYDVVTYSSKTGWTSTMADSEVNLYFHRNYNNPVSVITVTTDGDYKKEDIDSSTMKYTLTSNGKYVFTTNVKMYSIWGGDSDEAVTYGIVIKGIAGTSSKCNLLIPAPYDITLGTGKDLTLPEGEFTTLTGFTPSKTSSANGNTNWKVNFAQAGTYTTVYTPNSCPQTSMIFNVIPSSPTPATTAAGKQSVTGNQGTFTDDTSKIVIIVIVFALVAGAIILFLKKRGGKGRGRDRIEEESGAT